MKSTEAQRNHYLSSLVLPYAIGDLDSFPAALGDKFHVELRWGESGNQDQKRRKDESRQPIDSESIADKPQSWIHSAMVVEYNSFKNQYSTKIYLYFEFHLTSMNSSVSAVEITQDIQDGLFKIELITETN